MSAEPTVGVRLSVLDRLMEGSGRLASPTSSSWAASPDEFKATFLRDLDWLLNTRRVPDPTPDRYRELQHSVYYYGLPDVTSLSADSGDAHQRLARDIEECIRIFEPRLTSARVFLAAAGEAGERRVRFVIDGVLRMDPQTERIVLDTVLETPTGKFTVAGEGDA